MSVKRGAGDLDPDYEDLAEQQAKRQRVIEKDARQASVDTIRRIMATQISMELENKEMEAREADKRLNEARVMMDRLRAVVVASFYSRQQDERGKSTSEDWVPSVHPTAKKHLGKAPVGVEMKTEKSDPPSCQSKLTSDLSSSADKAANVKKNDSTKTSTQSKGVVSASPPSSTRPSSSTKALGPALKSDQEEEQGNSRFSTKRTIVVGNCSRFLLPHQRQPSNPSTHKWMVYVRGPRDKPDISDVVSKVWFFLHPSYRPCDLVEVKEPPFHLSRRGWGEFPVRVQLHFHDSRNKRMDVIHNLVLDKTYTGLQTLGAETVVSVDLVKDPIPWPRSRPSTLSTHSDHVVMEAAIKHKPGDIHPGSAEFQEDCGCGAGCTHSSVCRKPGENPGTDCQQRGRGSELREARNITIKEDCLDHCEEGSSARSTGVKSPSSVTGSDLVIKQEPGDGDQVDSRWQDVEGGGDCHQLSHKIKTEESRNCLLLPQQTAGLGLNGISGEVGRACSVDVKPSVDSLLGETGQPINFSGSAASTLSTGQIPTPTSVDAGTQSQMSIRKPVSLLPADPIKVNSHMPGSRTGLLGQMCVLNTVQPQKSVDGLTAGGVRVLNTMISQTAVSGMSAGQVHQIKAAPVKKGDSASVSGVGTLTAVSSLRAVSTGPVHRLQAVSPQTSVDGVQLPSSAAGAVKMVVVNPGRLPLVGQEGAVSLLTGVQGLKQTTAAVAASVPVSLMKVTAHSLKPVQAAGKAPGGSPAHLVGATPPPLLARHSAVLNAQASSQGPLGAASVKPSVVCSATVHSSASSQKSGMRSLLKTAAKPGIQALLQKSSPLPASCVSPASVRTQSLLSLPGQQSSSVTPSSGRPIVPGSNASGGVHPTPTLTSSSPLLGPTSSPYVLAQMNNRKVLVRLNAKQLVKEVSSGVQPACPGSDIRSSINSERKTLLPVRGAPLSNHFPPTGQQTVLQNSAIRLSAAPSISLQTALQTRNTLSNEMPKQDVSAYKSQAGLELAKAKAALQAKAGSNAVANLESLLSISMTQLASLKEKMQNAVLPPPKPRCGRWFSQGLGSGLALDSRMDPTAGPAESDDVVTPSPAVVTPSPAVVTPSPAVVRAASPGKSTGEGKEKRIMVVKKKPPSGLNLTLTGSPVPRLSVKEYSCMGSLIKAAVLRHPLLAPMSEKTIHPYCASSLEQWISWHSAKRNACEWSRAVAVRKYLQKYLGTEGTCRGEKLWSTKTIMQWCRCSGLSPNGPGGRPLMKPESSPDHMDMPCLDKPLLSVSDFEELSCVFQSQDRTKVCEEDSTELDIVAVEPCSKTPASGVKEEPPLQVGFDLHFDFLPSTVEAQFVQDTAAQVGVRFSPAVLAPGVFSSTAEDMLFGTMMEFASDLLHHACLAATSDSHDAPKGPHVTLTSREVLQALKTLPTASFLGNQYCGIPDSPSPPTTTTPIAR